jgi:peptidoglycan/xylan/chitin deacetylase (PgdA/CDA1 family)
MRLFNAVPAVLQRGQESGPRPLILMYHRIADLSIDPWELAVKPVHFEEQLDVLRRTRSCMSLVDFVECLYSAKLPPDAIALTFDDGYVDNLLEAKPRLEAAAVPATIFLPTGYLGRPDEFWWDELARLILGQKASQELVCRIGEQVMSFGIRSCPPPCGGDPWRACGKPLTLRHEAYIRIWQAIRLLSVQDRHAVMVQIRSAFASAAEPEMDSRPMTLSEVHELIADGLVAVGAHTVTHPLLTGLDRQDCRLELMESKSQCEDLVGRPITGFAYPYGDLNSAVRYWVSAAGFAYALSTIRAPAGMMAHPFALPRVQVLDWNGDAFEAAIRGVR